MKINTNKLKKKRKLFKKRKMKKEEHFSTQSAWIINFLFKFPF